VEKAAYHVRWASSIVKEPPPSMEKLLAPLKDKEKFVLEFSLGLRPGKFIH